MTQNEKAAAAKKRNHAIMIIILILLFILFIMPFILVIINVFKTKADIVSDPLALVGAHGFTMQNFPEAMAKMNFFNVFKNSLIITIISTVLTIFVSAMASFVIVRNGKWKFWRNLRSAQSPSHSDSDAHRILSLHGYVHVPRSNTY